jgi:hypothetical protein
MAPYIPCGSHMVPSVSHGVCRSHTVHTTPIQHMQLSPGTICLPHGARSSHMASIWHMWFPYGASSSYVAPSTSHMATSGSIMVPTAPIQCQFQCCPPCMQISYSSIHLPYGAHNSHMALCGERGSCMTHDGALSTHTVHTALIWSSYVTCGSHIVPSDSHTVPAAPVWCMWLP